MIPKAPKADAIGEEEVSRSILDHVPAMIWVTAADGRCTYVNSAWSRFTGQGAREALGDGWLDAVHPADRAAAERVFVDANAGRAPYQLDFRLRAASGDYRWVTDAGSPRFAEDGAFLGYVGSVVDIHDRHEAEHRFRALTNFVPAFVWFASQDGELHYLNDRWYAYSGQTPEEALPNGWTASVHPEDLPGVLVAWEETRARRQGYAVECRFRRRDGMYRWYLVRADPIGADGNEPLAWIGNSIDIHDLKLAEERQCLLINELNHRVKNTLATVQALAAQILQASPDVDSFREGFEDRLISLGQAHDLLTAARWAGARLSDVVERAVAPWRGAEIEADGPVVWLDPAQALSISMALHELATNAAKYGALSDGPGRLHIHWHVQLGDAGEVLRLRWKECGGPPVAPPSRRGFGSRLLERGLGRELQGTVVLQFPPDGVECVITCPLRLTSEPASAA